MMRRILFVFAVMAVAGGASAQTVTGSFMPEPRGVTLDAEGGPVLGPLSLAGMLSVVPGDDMRAFVGAGPRLRVGPAFGHVMLGGREGPAGEEPGWRYGGGVDVPVRGWHVRLGVDRDAGMTVPMVGIGRAW